MVVGFSNADVAQLAEQPPRKWQVVSSNLTVGSNQPLRLVQRVVSVALGEFVIKRYG